MSEMINFLLDLQDQLPLILNGLGYTLLLAAIISVTGFIMGIFILYFSLKENIILRKLTNSYISFFIGTPLIVILFLVYYGLPQYHLHLSTFAVAVICFTLNVGAYNAAYLKTAYNGLDNTELKAAKAQGFTDLEVFKLIVLPQVMRTSIPALTNQVISNLKDTSVAFLIEFTGFFARIEELASSDFQFFKSYVFAALVYLILVSIIVIISRKIEHGFLGSRGGVWI
ncbi:amino acid ABC transporter permease [Cysteiniphilum sp. QT6929]|uniref:amino acid ABC transporter permease n=1 Tax=Cysteiniphilum sp. QT6929 TaxID=2975055 RepID=UPI0024B35990|nr:amino acid ABC transporter permease [Cysteiniphilum sp. QT6929]WHN65096.1 amino acid ABC transporter permease [Cysteiniphilum sp. QT6929]